MEAYLERAKEGIQDTESGKKGEVSRQFTRREKNKSGRKKIRKIFGKRLSTRG